MNRKNLRTIKYICIFIAIIISPFYAFAGETEEGETEETVAHESGFYYTIQKGDTLWDLSERFSDTPWLWPDLWHENQQIPNPHLIYPGERIRLLYQEGVENVEIPVETVANEIVLQEKGQSKDPEESETPEEKPEKEPPYYSYPMIDTIGFIKKKPVMSHGVILKTKGSKIMISQDDVIYIKPTGNTQLALGSRYTVYRTLKPIKNKKTKEIVGVQHYLTGLVEITKKEPLFAIARVIRSYRTIELNDLIMPYKRRSQKIILTESKKGLDGKIIIGEEGQMIIGPDHIVFIDKGYNDGVKSGQAYDIYYQEKQQLDSKNKKDFFATPVVFGGILVLDTEETTSTVLITRSDKNISPGEKISSPQDE